MAKRYGRPSEQYRYEHYDPRIRKPNIPEDSSSTPSQQYRYEHYDPRGNKPRAAEEPPSAQPPAEQGES